MIPLNVRSHYSFMWGTAPIRDLCGQARALGYKRLALTDTDNLCGLWSFVRACRRQDLVPVIGAELTDPRTDHRAVCLVKDSRGYRHLTRLISRRHRDPGFCLKTDLPLLSEGLIVLTRNPDLLPFWHGRQVDLAVNLARHPLSRRHPLHEAATRLDIPLVATPGSFFLARSDIRIHRLLRAIATRTDPGRLCSRETAPDSAFLESPETYRQRFHILPQAVRNTRVLAEKLNFTGPAFGTVMPPLKNPSGGAVSRGEALRLLHEKTLQGALRRYGRPLPGPVRSRIDHELAIIREKNFCEYFLVVQQIVRKAPRSCGRGSGAASIVAFCLGITHVCPIRHNLYFERFLNLERTDPPDIDIDFAWDERDRILAEVLTEFKGHAAMVAVHILFQPRMAVRETARVFGLPEAEIRGVTRRLPWFWRLDAAEPDLMRRIRRNPESACASLPHPWPEIMSLAGKLVGTPRHLSVHPGGVILTPDPIDTYVPLETAPKGVPLIQWEKDGAETAGLVKIDLLGNRSLGVIRDTIHSIQTGSGKFDDFDRMNPEDDPDTRRTLAQGRTMGCFYVESPAMRLLQQKTGVGDFEHVVIHSSIIRPAANEYIREYVRRLHAGTWQPVHPLLDEVLKDTLGIMVYQEDVSRAAVALAGFSHAGADQLRRVLSRKDREMELRDFHDRFQTGARAKGVSPEVIQTVWHMIVSFAGYSFCKPHSASYARVSFQAAYLKTHYPAAFMAAVLTNRGGFYSSFAYVSEARRMGLIVLSPDVNHSRTAWQGSGRVVRVGLMAVRDLSAHTLAAIASERGKRPFTDPEDFFTRVRPREDEARALIHSGSLDALDPAGSRAALLWRYAARHHSSGPDSEPTLFDPAPAPPAIPEFPADDPITRLRQEFRTLGFLCALHPMALFQDILRCHDTVKAATLGDQVGRHVTAAGWLITGKTVQTRRGRDMQFLTFEDDTGLLETVFFPEVHDRFRHLLEDGKPFLLRGRVASDHGALTLDVDHLRPLGRS